MTRKSMKYEEAMAQLEAIVTKMESGQMELDDMRAQLKKAQELIKFCSDKLTETNAGLEGLLEKGDNGDD